MLPKVRVQFLFAKESQCQLARCCLFRIAASIRTVLLRIADMFHYTKCLMNYLINQVTMPPNNCVHAGYLTRSWTYRLAMQNGRSIGIYLHPLAISPRFDGSHFGFLDRASPKMCDVVAIPR